ncbi:ccmar2 transposase [Trichonephila clavipes]|nr:ccmar2 transposase [Trichonephila clavipes]
MGSSRTRNNSCDLLKKRNENDPFLKRPITGDEKWVVYNNIKGKRSRSRPGEPTQTTSKADIHQKKVLLSVWRLESGQTQTTVPGAVGEIIRVSLQEGKIDSKKQGIFNIGQDEANNVYSLTAGHCASQRKWAAEHQDCMQSDWSYVLFMDESRFSLEYGTRSVLIWLERDPRDNPIFVQERSYYRVGGLMVWVGISIGGRNDLHIIQKVNLADQSFTRSFGDGPRNFEPWSSDVDDTPSPIYHTNERTFELSTDLTGIAALHGGSLVILGSNS